MDFSSVKERIQKPTSKATSQRSAELEPFVVRLNESRVLGGYKPLGAGFYGSRMAHISTEDLPAFYKKLDQSDNFCALWWWYCQPKKK